MDRPGLAPLLGYDPTLVRALPASDRHALDWLASGVVFASVLSCAPLAYCVWLATHHTGLTWALALASLGLLAAMVRLSVAGSPYASVSAGSAGAATYAGPLVVLVAAATLAAQPAQLFLMRDELTEPLTRHREALVARHEASSGCVMRGDCVRYRAQLRDCDFVALQLQTLWARPGRAARDSVIFVTLVLLPTVLGRLVASRALRRYARLRLMQARRVVRHAAERHCLEVERALIAYPTYVPRTHASKLDDPLRKRWAASEPS